MSVQMTHFDSLWVKGPCIITVIPTVDCSTRWLVQLAIQNIVYCLLALAVLNITRTLCKALLVRHKRTALYNVSIDYPLPPYNTYTEWTIKKRDILFLTITLANLNGFLQFLYHFNREEILHATVVKIYHSTLIVCAPYFVNLNNNTFQSKMLLFFVHLRSQQKGTEKVISNNQIYSAAILTLLFWE